MIHSNREKNDSTVVLIGFSFIILISGLFFLRSHLSDLKKKKLADNASQAMAEKIKSFSSISGIELSKRISNKEKLTVLDLRDADSFVVEHIIGSQNISVEELQTNISKLDKNRAYFLVDNLGLTPNEIWAMQFFKDNGFANVAYLEGGLTQWKNEYQSTIGIADSSSTVDWSKVTYMKNDTLNSALSNKNSLYIIDVRSHAEYTAGHIPGAVNIYLDEIENRYREIPLGKKVILYDNDGSGAFQGGVKLFDLGVLGAYILSDGLDNWKQQKYPIVTQ